MTADRLRLVIRAFLDEAYAWMWAWGSATRGGLVSDATRFSTALWKHEAALEASFLMVMVLLVHEIMRLGEGSEGESMFTFTLTDVYR